MKWTLYSFALFVFLSLGSTLCFTATSKIIYGFERAEHFNGRTGADIYIQAGSFVSPSAATQYQKRLQEK